jgi:hypothetical protein
MFVVENEMQPIQVNWELLSSWSIGLAYSEILFYFCAIMYAV